ncbi:MAG: hypothetical protein JW738_00150 [Actinobacteria bacterium]|nr:hypothetical protein [Actinomycetota bacterium]
MDKSWVVSFGENERMELERILLDDDPDAALVFLRDVVYEDVKGLEKTGSCYHDVEKPVEGLGRPVKRHKNLGS